MGIDVREQTRRAAIEAMIDAHYDVGCDATRELAWYDAHPEAKAALAAWLVPQAFEAGVLSERERNRLGVPPALAATQLATVDRIVAGGASPAVAARVTAILGEPFKVHDHDGLGMHTHQRPGDPPTQPATEVPAGAFNPFALDAIPDEE